MIEGERKPKEVWWSIYEAKCPECGSKKVEGQGRFKYIFHKKHKTQELYKCKMCGKEFYA